MKNVVVLLAVWFFSISCSTAQTAGNYVQVSAEDFAKQLNLSNSAVLVDVRSPEEFKKGHIEGAKNLNFSDGTFTANLTGFDKSKTVMVYCLSGGRSAAAANILNAKGFTSIVELKGGIMKWRAAGLPEVMTVNKAQTTGMTKAEFDLMTNDTKPVLVDFYADWCGPCQKMKPYLEEIAKEGQVKVIRINVDENAALCLALKISELPVLQVYKNGKQTWAHQGYITKQNVLREL